MGYFGTRDLPRACISNEVQFHITERATVSKAKQQLRALIEHCRVRPRSRVRLKDCHTTWETKKKLPKAVRKRELSSILTEDVSKLAEAQDLLYAADSWSILLIFQAMDAAGKDSTIKHVMSGVNPEGCQVFSFKRPSTEELDHTFLWRCMKALPERGRFGIFNRSYYEEVLVAKVHPEVIAAERLPEPKFNKAFWEARYDDINQFEKHLSRNGTRILKFFLHVSKEEQRQRFLDRLSRSDKHWKFSIDDLKELRFLASVHESVRDLLRSDEHRMGAWYVIPADQKRVTRTLVAAIISDAVAKLGLEYPEVTPEKRREIKKAKVSLRREKN